METVFLWIFFVLAGIVILRIAWYYFQWWRSGTKPVVTEEVKVIAVRDETGTFARGRRNRASINLTPGYDIKFEVLSSDKKGKKKRFYVRDNKIGEPIVGSKGILTTKGIRFISFEHRGKC